MEKETRAKSSSPFSCFPWCRKARSVDANETSAVGERGSGRGSVYHDAEEGSDDEWNATGALPEPKTDLEKSIYADALQVLGESVMKDWGDVGMERVKAYPRVVTTSAPKKPRRVSIAEPETLLRQKPTPSKGMKKMDTVKMEQKLKEPDVKIEEKGYPGQLTAKEVEVCQRFRKELQKRDEVYSEIVFSYNEVEEEPFALCRFLRARRFDVDEVFVLIDSGVSLWLEAKGHDFYPDIEEALGVPESIILSQYPRAFVGTAKNGCPVSYLNAGNINAEGLLCLICMDDFTKFFWHSSVFTFVNELASAKKINPNIVRCEGIAVMDLNELSASQLNNQTFEVIKKASEIGVCFPEVLHCMIILNAPRFFSFSWRIIKNFLDPRTADKIQIFSNAKKGKDRLNELIDEKHIPSDYGGSAQSIAAAMQVPGSRQIVKLLQTSSRGEAQCKFELAKNERTSIHVHTRSNGGASFSMFEDSNLIESIEVKKSTVGKDSGAPYSTAFSTDLMGPGKFCIKAKANSGSSEYFLAWGRVIKPQ